ncbi:MAG: hypothetical protein F6K28_31515, partial [Microcoleus sp. SIO2G3]|nr:hypothetical protein [Microcoleus sp. SIO2G3]
AFVLPANSPLESVVDRLAELHDDCETAEKKGLVAAEHLQGWTWEQQTLKLLHALNGAIDQDARTRL